MIVIALALIMAASEPREAGPPLGDQAPIAAVASDGPPSSEVIDAILKAPETVEPANYISVVQALWLRGDREQAAFWFYIFQSRTRAWARSDETYAQARGALNMVVGQTINEWAGSDMDAYVALAERAVAYEKKFPFYAGRPEDVEPAKWTALMLKERAAYAAELAELGKQLATKKSDWETARRQAGLYVGPWRSPGEPLPEHWR